MKIVWRDCPACGETDSLGIEYVPGDVDYHRWDEGPRITVSDCGCRMTNEQENAVLGEFAAWDMYDWIEDTDRWMDDGYPVAA
jgi:phage terminase large subunit GpA-like protein